jgi:hypothetical protein
MTLRVDLEFDLEMTSALKMTLRVDLEFDLEM